mgnify:CR=1 FL=1
MEQNTKAPGTYPYEDRALKGAAQVLGEALVSFTGIGRKLVRVLPTEQVIIRTEVFQEDFNYELEDGKILHLEFESDELTKEDLMRFRGYEAVLSYQHKKDVITCVLCSAKAKKLKSRLDTGMNTYQVQVIRLKNWDAEELLLELERKQEAQHPLRKEEMLKLVLLPLMGGELSQKARIRRGFELFRRETDRQKQTELRQAEGVLYILAQKFLKDEELEGLKEEIKMTFLGQMMYDDGWNDGEKKGMGKCVLELLTDLGSVPEKVRDSIMSTEDEDKLKTWLRMASKAQSLEDFCKTAGLPQ